MMIPYQPSKVEYRVRTVTRYNVTRYEEGPLDVACNSRKGSSIMGVYDSEDTAHEVGYALCKAEHDRLGWPVDDGRIQYPKRAHKGERPDDLVISISTDTSALTAQLDCLEPRLRSFADLVERCGINSDLGVD